MNPDEPGAHDVFHLRPTARWSAGTPVVAEDVVRGLRRAVDSPSQGPSAGLLAMVRDVTDIRSGRALAACDARVGRAAAALDSYGVAPLCFAVSSRLVSRRVRGAVLSPMNHDCSKDRSRESSDPP